jgi:hypothetical protein
LQTASSRSTPCTAKKTFEAAAANAHLIVQLKENQPSLHGRVKDHCRKAPLLSGAQTIDDKCRNRHETRIVGVFDAAPAVADSEWETHVAAIIAVERTVHAFQPATGLFKTSNETSFYLSIVLSAQSKLPPPFAATGASKIALTMCATSHCARTPHVFAKTPASSPESAASLTIS